VCMRARLRALRRETPPRSSLLPSVAVAVAIAIASGGRPHLNLQSSTLDAQPATHHPQPAPRNTSRNPHPATLPAGHPSKTCNSSGNRAGSRTRPTPAGVPLSQAHPPTRRRSLSAEVCSAKGRVAEAQRCGEGQEAARL